MTNYNNIPTELKDLKQWVSYAMFERDNGKKGKMPIDPVSLTPAKANDPKTWGTYDQAINSVGETITFRGQNLTIEGIGIQFASGLFGIDLDNCIVDGKISPLAIEIMETMNSYSEVSPSGTGVHILAFGTLPKGGRRNDGLGIEMYDTTRFFTVTGKRLKVSPTVETRTEQAARIHSAYMNTAKDETTATVEPQHSTLNDNEVLNKMFGSRNGAEIRALYAGDLSAYADDHSAADFGLVNHLVYWCNGDANQVDRLFRNSELMRDKWDRKQSGSTYGAITINRALQDFTPYRDTGTLKIKGTSQNGKKQPLESFYKDRTQLHPKDIKNEPAPIKSAREYLLQDFKGERERFSNYKQRKTGYKNIDDVTGGLYPGLYVIGALSSLGKTTFMHQMADQLAKKGEKVLFFSLEQSAFEMTTKSLAREAYKLTKVKSELRSAIQIRKGEHSDTTKQALKNYIEYAENLYIVECNFDFTMKEILETVEDFMTKEGVNPVVIVDYLQIIPASDPRMSDKEKTDQHVRALKIMQRDYDLVVFAISSLNRGNYLSPVSFESFKESGGIEYTADVVLGMQYSVLNTDLFTVDSKSNTLAKRRNKLNEAKRESPRKIEIVCLKNRYGRDYTVNFDYMPAYDYFTPSELSEYEKFNETTNEKIRVI